MPVSSPLVVTTMQDGAVAVDPAGRITDLNPAAERVLGEVKAGKHEVRAELTVSGAAGDRVHEASDLTIRSAGERVRGHLRILRDTTGRTQAFEALRESEALPGTGRPPS